MSHFSVLVIGPDVERQLAPYHEFECTGEDNEFVQDIDITEAARQKFAAATADRLRGPDGKLHSFFDEAGSWRPEFSKLDETAPSFASDKLTYHVPEGYERVAVLLAEVESFADFVEDYYGAKPVAHGAKPDLSADAHKWGYIQLGPDGEVVKVIDRTNPNKRWDWYQVGGRWSGKLLLKAGATGEVGERSWTNQGKDLGANRVDSARKGDIDLAGIRDVAGEKAGALWDQAATITGGQTWEAWEVLRERHKDDIDLARERYHAQPALVALKAAEKFRWDVDDNLALSRAAYVQLARDKALSTWAVLKDGVWAERGKMGWFGTSTGDLDQATWNKKLNELIESLADDTLLTVVDCHI